jgi:methyl-accepting chemotaxis protein
VGQSSGSKVRSRAIERFISGIIIALVAFAVAAALVNSALNLMSERDRERENARDTAETAAMMELVAVHKQIQIDVIQVQQWLTDVSATRGLDGLDDGWAQAADNAEAFKRDVARAKVLARQLGAADLEAAFDEVATPFDDYYQTGQRMARAYVDQGPAGGNATMAEFDATAAQMTAAIEAQVERFAPGFRQRILARATRHAAAMELYNANYVGGDINGGVQDLFQHFTRPSLSLTPYRTPNPAAVASSELVTATALPSSSGCANAVGGAIHLSP